MTVRVALCGGAELTSAAQVLGLIAVDAARADLALVDLRDAEAVSSAAALPPALPRVVVLGDEQIPVASAPSCGVSLPNGSLSQTSIA